MRDAFPRPFTIERARTFITAALAATPQTRFAIEVDGAAVGGIGCALHSDVDRVSAELYPGTWHDIGTPERLAALNQRYNSGTESQVSRSGRNG